MTSPLGVTASHLTKRFGTALAVDDLSFEVARGEIYGLLGPNGAGKTTTLRVLAAILTPTSGRAELAGVDVARDPQAARSQLGFLTGVMVRAATGWPSAELLEAAAVLTFCTTFISGLDYVATFTRRAWSPPASLS